MFEDSPEIIINLVDAKNSKLIKWIEKESASIIKWIKLKLITQKI